MTSGSSFSRSLSLASIFTLSLDKLASAAERASSGLRINRASDDAAGLALSKRNAGDALLYSRAMENLNTGISFVNTASAALDAQEGVMGELLSLAQRASSTNLTTAQRDAINEEAQKLRTEYERISSTAAFNGQPIFQQPARTTVIQAGPSATDRIQFATGDNISQVSFETSVFGTTYDGTFQPRTTQSTGMAGSSETSMGSADFNGDGNVDVVTSKEGRAFIHYGNGDGTFAASVSLITYGGAGLVSNDLQLGDMNSDGFVDIVTSAYGAGSSGAISVILSNGNGTFQAVQTFAPDVPAYKITLGNFDNVAGLDVALVDPLLGTGTRILRGGNNGTFTAIITNIASGDSNSFLESGDVNGDGLEDLIVGSSTGNQQVLLRNGNMTFNAPTTLVGAYGREIVLKDINGDTFLDLVGGGSGGVGVYLGNGNGTFQAVQTTTITGSVIGTAVGDVDKDGIQDIIARVDNGGVGMAAVFVGNGDGTFMAATTQPGGTAQGEIVAVDVNNDGAADGIVAALTTLSVYLSNSTTGTVVDDFDLTTTAGASAAVTTFTNNLSTIAVERGNVAGATTRLERALGLASSLSNVLNDSATKILTGDVASLAADFLATQIRADQAGAIFAQSNLDAVRVGRLFEGVLQATSVTDLLKTNAD